MRDEPPAGLFPAWKRVDLARLARLRAPGPALSPACQETLVEANPWLRALRDLGHQPGVEAGAIPIEEGETSVNCNSSQALAGLSALLLGREQGVRLTVIGDQAGGNHGLDHALALLGRSFADAAGARAALQETLGDAARASTEALLAGLPRNVRKAFSALPIPVQRARALRLPAARIAAPDADRLRDLGAALGLDPGLRSLLSAVREAMAGVGLWTVADLFILLRGALIRRLASLLGADGLSYLPTSLEYLITRGTGEELAGRSLRELAARWHAAFTLAVPPREPRPHLRGHACFRVLNHYDPVRLLTRGAGRGGWGSLAATFATGDVVVGRETAGLAELPLRELLARGYGLSGKLTYLAVRAVNGGRVCNQVFLSPLSDVFAALADPGHPGLVLALRRIDVNGRWQWEHMPGRRPPLDLLVLTQWIERSPDPPATLARILGLLRDLWRDPSPSRACLLLDERPGDLRLA
jgi:hypothetical protein